ncbi:hypothetical protein PUNSTDRAFT_49557 [Punctularia strigosozonata HHB-11173 SS5]|uniref:uncharacterized protein n=1 Tax=Punctularia strigosozonata (strain HHB-11173) TaxID=741275 RepID=UPI0004416F0F|nr:uncharacterized protein PUNSTDRAFT_49557 [Punctularia strigosozonata HHB-11173 SS5]EIN12286.1 hypothetical protein PUNSTDRAFT_49557 [Punctularia strigosozonata HHB-11173 SS5]
MSDKVTVEKIATQYGLDTTYGAYAWRTVLQSPLDSERCRLLISKIAKPDVVPHRVRQATEQEPKVFPPPVAAGTDVSRTRDPPEPVIVSHPPVAQTRFPHPHR